MSKIDRRISKSQEAIKKAFIELMCELSVETDSIDAGVSWFEYFESKYLFFSAMFASSKATFFRSCLLEFLLKDMKNEWNINITEGKNRGLGEDVILQFFATAYIGVVEWWLKNGMPYPPHIMEEQIETLLVRNL